MVDKDGMPWIIDYGSAVQSRDPDKNPLMYQVVVGGKFHLTDDFLGLRELRIRVHHYMEQRKESQS